MTSNEKFEVAVLDIEEMIQAAERLLTRNDLITSDQVANQQATIAVSKMILNQWNKMMKEDN